MSVKTLHVAVSLDDRWAAETPADIGRAAGRLDDAGADVLILGGASPGLDSLILAGWLAIQMKRAGLVPVLPALHTLPFHAARALSALDILTRGRSGWAPSSLGHAEQAKAVGPQAQLADHLALAKAVDLIDATCALWDSWDADALIIDKDRGVYLDPERVRRVHYRGPFFQVMGPLNAARPLQGYPVLVQSDVDPLWRQTLERADMILVEAPDPKGLAARRTAIADAGGQARLMATIGLGERRIIVEAVDELLDWLDAGLIDGVHLAPADAGSIDAITHVLMPELRERGRRLSAPQPGSLRSRLGLRDHENSHAAGQVANLTAA